MSEESMKELKDMHQSIYNIKFVEKADKPSSYKEEWSVKIIRILVENPNLFYEDVCIYLFKSWAQNPIMLHLQR